MRSLIIKINIYISIYIILQFVRSNPKRQHSQVLYHWGVRIRGKTEKHGKVRGKEKVIGASSASLFPARIQVAVTQDGTKGIENPTQRKTREPVSSKAGRTCETAGKFQIHSRKTRIRQGRVP